MTPVNIGMVIFCGIGLFAIIAFVINNKKRRRDMSEYTIVAIISKIDNQKQLQIRGVGKHLYKDSREEQWNLLEENDVHQTKSIKLEQQMTIDVSGNIGETLVAEAMLHKRPLKLTIEEETTKSPSYKVVSVEVP